MINLTADSFADIGGGRTRASGHVVLNNNFYLSGTADQITFDSSTMTGSGALVMSQGQLALLSGSFTIHTATGILTPGSVTYNLNRIAGLNMSGVPTGMQINVPAGAVTGAATLAIAMSGAVGDSQHQLHHQCRAGLLWPDGLARLDDCWGQA